MFLDQYQNFDILESTTEEGTLVLARMQDDGMRWHGPMKTLCFALEGTMETYLVSPQCECQRVAWKVKTAYTHVYTYVYITDCVKSWWWM